MNLGIRRRPMLWPLLKPSVRLVAGLILTLGVIGSGRRQPPQALPRPAGVDAAGPASVTAGHPQEPALGQKQERPEDWRIRVQSNLVTVPVSVKDKSGTPVRDLDSEDFRIEEEGAAQEIGYFGKPGTTPIDIALLMDVSASIEEHFELQKQAAAVFIKDVITAGNAISIIGIGSEPRVVLARTDSVEEALAAIRSLQYTRETTAFFDTVVEAAHQVRRSSSPVGRRALVVLSDGEDTSSRHHRLSGALSELQKADCVFYSINPSAVSVHLNEAAKRGQEGMSALAAETGGAFLPGTPQEVEAILARVAADLKGQYLLGYYPSGEATAGMFRRILVRLPGKLGLQVQARRGYYPATP